MAKPKKTKMVVTNITNPNDPYLNICVGLYDRKAEVFIEASMVANTGVAMRSFTQAINTNNPESNLWKWPGDYDIYLLGHYNPRTGQLIPQEKRLLAAGEAIKVRE